MKNKEPADELLTRKNELTKERDAKKSEMDLKEAERDQKLILIGNIVHDSVPVSNNEVCCYQSLSSFGRINLFEYLVGR